MKKSRTSHRSAWKGIVIMAMALLFSVTVGHSAHAADPYITDPTNLRWEGAVACWNASKAYYDQHYVNPQYKVTVYADGESEDPVYTETVSTPQCDISGFLSGYEGRTGTALNFKVQAIYASLSSNEVACTDAVTFKLVAYDYADGSSVLRTFAPAGRLLPKPEAPTMEGKVFALWYKEWGYENLWDFDEDIVEDDMRLYAKWDEPDAHSHDGVSFIPWDEKTSLPSEAGNYYLVYDVTLNGTWKAPSGNTSLCLNGHNITSSSTVMRIVGGSTVDIYDHNETPGSIQHIQPELPKPSYGHVIRVEGGIFNLHDAVLKGGYTSYDDGAGVHVNSGLFEMFSGSITECTERNGYGGGVCVYGQGTFRMRGGTISGNMSTFGGGVYLISGKFEISGGTITGNKATYHTNPEGGGVQVYPQRDAEASMSLIPAIGKETTDKIIISGNENGDLHLATGGSTPSSETSCLKITTKVSDDTRISVLKDEGPDDDDPLVFTSGFKGNAALTNFTSTREEYAVDTVKEGETDEAALKVIHTVSFDPGTDSEGNIPTGSMDAQTVLDRNDFEIPDLGYDTPAGHTFAGWKIGETTYGDKATVENVISDLAATAQWNAVAYKLTYDLDGGSLAEPNPENYTVSDTVTLNNPTKDGYEFLGWSGTDIEGMSKEVTIPKGSTNDRSYKANWRIIEYNISYRLNGGKLPAGKTNPTSYTCEDEDFTLNNPTRAGFDFVGWYGTGVEEETTTVTIAKGSIGKRFYVAVFEEKEPASSKLANPLAVKARKATIRRAKIRKKAQKLAVTKVIRFTRKGEGAMRYKLISAKKGKKSFKKRFKINAKTGKLTVKKGLKKGTYKVKIRLMAAGNANYNASAWKTVTSKVRVK